MTGRCARRTRMHRAACPDRGSATVLGLGVLGVVVTVLLAGLLLARVSLASGVARAAADLGAVAGAQVLHRGGAGEAACARAGALVAANGAQMRECTASPASETGRGPELVVHVRAPTGLAPWPWAEGRARAGLVVTDP